jgi:hypothetical protein
MNPQTNPFMKTALIVVAISFLLYTFYQAITTTFFVVHFPTVIDVLPHFITSSQPKLQLALFLFQELAGSVGSYLRLTAAILAVNSSILYLKNNPKYLQKLRLVLFFESLYFLLLLPAAANQLIGSVISTSAFLNFYTGISVLLQTLLIFPALFLLSRKLKYPQDISSIFRWVVIAAPLYLFGFWVRHGLFWVYALSSSAPPQIGFLEALGFVNSWLTLLVAAIVTTVACLDSWRHRKPNLRFVGATICLVGVYFVIYDLVSVWVPVYRDFLPLTDFWMLMLPILGVALWFKTWQLKMTANSLEYHS